MLSLALLLVGQLPIQFDERLVYQGHSPLESLASFPRGNRLLLSTAGAQTYVLDPSSGQAKPAPWPTFRTAFPIADSTIGDIDDQTLEVARAGSFQPIHRQHLPEAGQVTSASASVDAQYLAIGFENGVIWLSRADLQSRELVAVSAGKSVDGIQWLPRADLVVSSGNDLVRVSGFVSSGQRLRVTRLIQVTGGLASFRFAQHRNRLLICGENGSISLFISESNGQWHKAWTNRVPGRGSNCGFMHGDSVCWVQAIIPHKGSDRRPDSLEYFSAQSSRQIGYESFKSQITCSSQIDDQSLAVGLGDGSIHIIRTRRPSNL